MLSRLDPYLIKWEARNRHSAIGRFAGTKTGFVLTTLLALYQCATELGDAIGEGHILLSAAFTGICALLVFISLRHIFWKKRVEHYEYRLKLLEAAVILYAGFDKYEQLGRKTGYTNTRGLVLLFFTLALACFYGLLSRSFYLKNKSLLQDRKQPDKGKSAIFRPTGVTAAARKQSPARQAGKAGRKPIAKRPL